MNDGKDREGAPVPEPVRGERTTDERLIELESKLAFQERTIEQLDGALIEYEDRFRQLAKRVDRLERRLEERDGE